MKKSQLSQLLASMDSEELARLEKFAQSPYFNNRTEVVKLCSLLTQSIRKGKPLPTKEKIFAHLFGDREYDDHRLRVATSLLHQLTCRFIRLEALEKDQIDGQRVLAQTLRQRNLPERSIKALKQASQSTANTAYQNADQLDRQYQLALEQYQSAFNNYHPEKSDLQALSSQLDSAYLARKLWQACFLISHSKMFSTQLDHGLLDTVIDYLRQRPEYLALPAIGLYYHCYLALTQPAEISHFRTFMQIFKENSNIFPNFELRDIFVLAVNFCSMQYNAGNQQYLREQFNLYQEGLERGFFIVDGTLPPYTYTNAATLGLILGELTWVEQFVEEFAPVLRPEHRDSLFHFNRARLAYHQHQLGVALQLLQKAEYKDVMMNLAAKALQVKIYFELGELDVLASHLQAFKAFLQRRKLGYHRDNYLRMVQFMDKILETGKFDKTARAMLRIRIQETKALAEKEWLLAQL